MFVRLTAVLLRRRRRISDDGLHVRNREGAARARGIEDSAVRKCAYKTTEDLKVRTVRCACWLLTIPFVCLCVRRKPWISMTRSASRCCAGSSHRTAHTWRPCRRKSYASLFAFSPPFVNMACWYFSSRPCSKSVQWARRISSFCAPARPRRRRCSTRRFQSTASSTHSTALRTCFIFCCYHLAVCVRF